MQPFPTFFFDNVQFTERTPHIEGFFHSDMNHVGLAEIRQLLLHQIEMLEAISRANINMQISRPPMKKKMASGKPKSKKKQEKNVK